MNIRHKIKMSENEWNLIKMLREEAREVKECYTKFSFQALAFTVTILGLVFKFQKETPIIAFTCITSIIILLRVARIGTFKYNTANRNFGYELHLQLTSYLQDSPPNGWQAYMREIGWEEVMRAWRVVQATMFSFLYTKNPSVLKKNHKLKTNRWFEPNTLIVGGSNYHAGTYLKEMNFVLHLMALISTIPLLIFIFQSYEGRSWILILSLVGFILLVLIIYYFIRTNSCRRKILENGLLSIHSCAIAWHAVVVAHFRALKMIEDEEEDIGLSNYIKYLSDQAKDLTVNDNIFNIHKWILDSGERPFKN